LGNEFFGKKGEKPSEEKPSEVMPEPKENPKPKPKLKPFHCDHCGRDGHLVEFCFRRKREERLARKLANKDRYRRSRGVPKARLVPRGEGMVRTIYPREGVSSCLEVIHYIEKVVGVLGLGVVSLLDIPLLMVKSLGYNLLSVSQLLDKGFEVHFKMGCSRVLDSRADLV
jgi:hypothetical protein